MSSCKSSFFSNQNTLGNNPLLAFQNLKTQEGHYCWYSLYGYWVVLIMHSQWQRWPLESSFVRHLSVGRCKRAANGIPLIGATTSAGKLWWIFIRHKSLHPLWSLCPYRICKIFIRMDYRLYNAEVKTTTAACAMCMVETIPVKTFKQSKTHDQIHGIQAICETQ